MRYSKLFGKTRKNISDEIKLSSHKYMLQGGFIEESVAGRYYFLPLGYRVRTKLIQIVREEMDAIGAQEMITPVLHPLELWEETNRTEAVNFELMRITDRRGAEFALGGTAEEMFVDLVRKYQLSYRDLPFTIYQFSPKFRDEMRARGGLLRAREFLMKDAYSFHTDADDFEIEYENQKNAYTKIYERVGLHSKPVAADGGYIGGDYCHEFIVDSEVGESRYLESEDGKYVAHEDVAEFTHEEVNPDEELKEFETIEQPDWVRTMEENEKHYGKDARHFLKNVVYVNFQGDIIIASVRGDIEVNSIKLKNLLGEDAELEDATDEDLAAMGTKSGYVHSWGHEFLQPRKAKTQDRDCKVIYVADNSLKTVKNFIGGQKEETTDSCNVNYGRDFKHEIEGDIAMAQAGYLSPDGKTRLVEKKGVEVGNIFQLGYHYTNKMAKAVYKDNNGEDQKLYMGCYGIGIGRTMATVVEVSHDEHGIIWPDAIAPYQIHLVGLNLEDEEIRAKAEKVYEELSAKNLEVLFDDREDVRPGEKFADADLIGIPYRVVVSKKTGDQLEVKRRNESDAVLINLDELVSKVNG
ncbi:proline--tRNA ligase [Candidatus Dojkabacteria bacterium]|uniref:Proline--tRNA ligase n=1 Tax=Candidatus Dojkabacteria bacterium TaxID=2099670 RepID=A0A955L4Y4_9BACT|nr:proline--tRNA ligase [Candidatus Dojkabacteria bacterium]